MATQNPALPVGAYVQYNPANDSPRSQAPSVIEQTIGIVRQSFTQQGEPYYMVVWNPGDKRPRVGTYHADQLNVLSKTQAQTVLQQLSAGTYQPTSSQQQSTSYTQPNLPTEALPPGLQGIGNFSPGPANTSPTLTETGT